MLRQQSFSFTPLAKDVTPDDVDGSRPTHAECTKPLALGADSADTLRLLSCPGQQPHGDYHFAVKVRVQLVCVGHCRGGGLLTGNVIVKEGCPELAAHKWALVRCTCVA